MYENDNAAEIERVISNRERFVKSYKNQIADFKIAIKYNEKRIAEAKAELKRRKGIKLCQK